MESTQVLVVLRQLSIPNVPDYTFPRVIHKIYNRMMYPKQVVERKEMEERAREEITEFIGKFPEFKTATFDLVWAEAVS